MNQHSECDLQVSSGVLKLVPIMNEEFFPDFTRLTAVSSINMVASVFI